MNKRSRKLSRERFRDLSQFFLPNGFPHPANDTARTVERVEASIELYHLKQDIGEQTDLAPTMPEKADALRKKLHAWREQVGAQLPSQNPNSDPEKDKAKPRQAQNQLLKSKGE